MPRLFFAFSFCGTLYNCSRCTEMRSTRLFNDLFIAFFWLKASRASFAMSASSYPSFLWCNFQSVLFRNRAKCWSSLTCFSSCFEGTAIFMSRSGSFNSLFPLISHLNAASVFGSHLETLFIVRWVSHIFEKCSSILSDNQPGKSKSSS